MRHCERSEAISAMLLPLVEIASSLCSRQ